MCFFFKVNSSHLYDILPMISQNCINSSTLLVMFPLAADGLNSQKCVNKFVVINMCQIQVLELWFTLEENCALNLKWTHH